MTLEFSFFLNIFLLSRLVFTFHDEPVEKRQVVIMTAIQWLGLLVYQPGWAILIAALALLGGNLLLYRLERKTKRINEIRLLFLLVEGLLVTMLFSPAIRPGFNSMLGSLAALNLYFAGFATQVDWRTVSVYVLGLLLITNEANLVIRTPFQVAEMLPRKPESQGLPLIAGVDRREYNAGRIIGILERIMIFFFILNNQYGAIGLVLAAKSFTRFKELENREFAEYVLVGTLMSTMLAMLVGLWVAQAV